MKAAPALEENFTNEQLFRAWDDFFESKKGTLADLEAMVLRKKPVQRDNFVLDLTIKNGIEINILKKTEEDLLSFLRATLRNNKVTINYLLEEGDTKEKLYTDSDKFNDMAKRNPVLLKLKDRLGLDTEY